MSKRIFSLVFVMVCLLLCSLGVSNVKSQSESLGFIYIKPDGSVEPSSAPIQRAGDVFTFTANIRDSIVIERNNVVLDGAGLYLQGNGTSSIVGGRDNGVGINVTSISVTITNIHIDNWVTGVLGAYNCNSIIHNSITGCNKGIRILGDDYNISENYIANNNEGVRLGASRAVITRNILIDNHVGLQVFYYNHLIVENNMSNVEYDISGLGAGGVSIYRNNFLKTDPYGYVLSGTQGGTWDNGSEGNYWSDYKGIDANHDGIGDTPFTVGLPHYFGEDRYPLMKPVILKASLKPSHSPISTPTPPLQTPTPTLTPTPTPIPPLVSSSSPRQTTPRSWQPTISILLLVAVFAVIIVVAVVAAFAFTKRKGNRFGGL